jgi:hypothetical protein
MHGVGDVFPACHLRGVVNAWGLQIALTFGADLRGFGNDQAAGRCYRPSGSFESIRTGSWPGSCRALAMA